MSRNSTDLSSLLDMDFHNNTFFNVSILYKMVTEKFSSNRNVNEPWSIFLIISYCILIVFGAAGNILVVTAVVRKSTMRTARNMFILNLAISDLLLCLITMPLTLLEILTNHWPFGNVVFICKLMGTLQAVSIFVSTISITAIALDRYQVIVYPTHNNIQIMGAVSILFAIWCLAILLASPLFIIRALSHETLPPILEPLGLKGSVYYCYEEWPLEHGRAIYSGFSFTIQYVLPIVIVSCAYLRIYIKLKHRIPVGVGAVNLKNNNNSRMERGRRMQRTNCLLIAIALLFGISWLPLNAYNLYLDIARFPSTESTMINYALCHMSGMSSAVINPFLYGWLNDNFRKEFQEILCRCKHTMHENTEGFNGSTRIRRQTLNTEITHAEHRLLEDDHRAGSSDAAAPDRQSPTELVELMR